MKTTERITITVNTDILADARTLEINLSKAASNGIEAAVKREQKIRELGI